MKPILSINHLIREAEIFCNFMSKENHRELLGVTDGKKVAHLKMPIKKYMV